MKKSAGRVLIEVASILFLFYSNLLMGEFERSGPGRARGLAWALRDVMTSENFLIGALAAFAGYAVFEYLRRKY